MGFIFRTVFFLSLALVALPPEARLGGGDETAEIRTADVANELVKAADIVWSSASSSARQVMATCETNPQLCEAGINLVNTTLASAADAATGVAVQLASEPKKPLADAESRKPRSEKIQARVE
ncbi:MAG: hypothetical protein HOP13_15290 [Alphaproteobacteria bacterium]|nr:hypothetical protein [Alphaproteobacteria bacterium]